MSWPFSLPFEIGAQRFARCLWCVVGLFFPRPLPGRLIECFAPRLRISVLFGEIVVLPTPENLDGLQDSPRVGAHGRDRAVAIPGAEPVDDEGVLGDDRWLLA